jgi:DDE superfamily endonuclease
MAQANAIWRY